MEPDKFKKFTNRAKSSIKGEAFFELLLTEFAIPHRIVGSKDIGIDYFCEWVFGDKPTGILFAAQVKTFQESNVTITRDLECERDEKNYNKLEPYIIKKSLLNFEKYQPETLQYWKGLGIPVYVFVVVLEKSNEISCYYRRYTPLLTSLTGHDDSGAYSEGFYKANDGSSFLAFTDLNKREYGFARDLFIDHVRCSYANGLITFIEPERIGLNRFQGADAFEDLIEQYEEQIRRVYEKTGRILQVLGKSKN